ncbi:MAG: type III-A CRISPR-associated protein Csm2 [Nitrospirae bacterium RBG_13_39_12]|nr:MAG: type III-A CRISPR-associated protein Csm2 [Nitrospirae bacterium RBG_13_39_12]
MKNKIPLEEDLLQKWGLKTTERIVEKIFENSSGYDGLSILLDADKLIACSYALGKILASYEIGLKAAQLRRFYESLLNIKTSVNAIGGKADEIMLFKRDVLPEIRMLKPQLASAKSRHPRELTPFFDVMNLLLDRVENVNDYDRLCQFGEAVVAYHKYCGGRD